MATSEFTITTPATAATVSTKTAMVTMSMPHGNDSGPATREEPLRTITGALGRLDAGDTVLVMPGDYSTGSDALVSSPQGCFSAT